MSRRRGTQHRRTRATPRAAGVITGQQLHILLLKYDEDGAEQIGLGGVFSTATRAEDASKLTAMFTGYKVVEAPLNVILFAYAKDISLEPTSD